ncbi:MAG: helix-hairpin-helix domain-containing protein [Deinococcota bacterium]
MNRFTKFVLLALTTTGLAGAQSTHTTGSMSMTGMGRCAKVLKAKVNLNKASVTDLECLKGVSATVAKDIVANRPFKDGNDFARKIEVIGHRLWNNNKTNLAF